MGASSVNGAGNGQVPGFQDGGSLSQQAIDKMSNEQLFNILKTGSEQDKLNAAAELAERLGGTAEKGEKGEKGAEKGEKGGSGGVDDEIMKLIEKLLRGEKLTPEEEEKLKAALGTSGGSGGSGGNPDVIGGPDATGPGKV